jgi:hypothetical protein
MHGREQSMAINTLIIGPVDIKIGVLTYISEIYVAPTDDDMLLGLDFMHNIKVVLDCCKQQITINSDILHMSYRKKELHIPKKPK